VGLTAPITGPLAGFTVAIAVVDPRDDLRARLEGEGARVVLAPASRIRSADPTPLRRMVDLITSRLVDAVAFTSPHGVGSLLREAGGATDDMLTALRSQVLVGCVGRVTADSLVRRGVPVMVPAAAGCGGLVRALVEELPAVP
jgi:uroporphyrinogen-III synthase